MTLFDQDDVLGPPKFFRRYMKCEHNWIEKQIPTPKGGYMVLKFCYLCRESEGYGFLDKDHEVNYLNKLYNLDTPDEM